MAKKVMGIIKLILPAGKATPSYPVGPALGPFGVNMMGFVNEFNKRTAPQPGLEFPVVITIFADRSFTMDLHQPTASSMLRRAAGIEKGSSETKRSMVGEVTRKQLYEVAEIKASDMNTDDMDAAVRVLAGTARSMGIQVVD